MNNEIVYLLTIEDLQNVANQELDRNLSLNEISIIKEKIAEKIDWFDVISSTINENIKH